MKEKQCFKCGASLPASEFYRHHRMADGYLGKCKSCTRRDVRTHRALSPRPREYDRLRSQSLSRKAASKKNVAAWREANPKAYKAQNKLNNAVRDGKIKRWPCEICGEERSHAHHKDYSKPLDVIWLCARHHHKAHSLMR